MDRTRLLLAIASVFAGTTIVLVIAGLVANPLFVALAAPFAVATYLLWADVTGRTARRAQARRARREPGDRSGRRTTPARATPEDQSRAEARRILGVGPRADETTIRRAYRERVKAVHPDADSGDEEAFKRVTAAYERLRE